MLRNCFSCSGLTILRDTRPYETTGCRDGGSWLWMKPGSRWIDHPPSVKQAGAHQDVVIYQLFSSNNCFRPLCGFLSARCARSDRSRDIESSDPGCKICCPGGRLRRVVPAGDLQDLGYHPSARMTFSRKKGPHNGHEERLPSTLHLAPLETALPPSLA